MKIEEISLALSITAIGFTIVNTYFQFRVRGAKVALLNAEDYQRCIVRNFAGLPKNIQDDFPNCSEEFPGHALIKLVFGNSGDRAGLINIKRIVFANEKEPFKPSYYTYILVPAYEIVEKGILLRNIPLKAHTIETSIVITMDLGGYNPRSGKPTYMQSLEKELYAELIPSGEIPARHVTQIG